MRSASMGTGMHAIVQCQSWYMRHVRSCVCIREQYSASHGHVRACVCMPTLPNSLLARALNLALCQSKYHDACCCRWALWSWIGHAGQEGIRGARNRKPTRYLLTSSAALQPLDCLPPLPSSHLISHSHLIASPCCRHRCQRGNQ